MEGWSSVVILLKEIYRIVSEGKKKIFF